MRSVKITVSIVTVVASLGVLCTTRAEAEPTNNDTSFVQARALRRAGKENEALAELRRAKLSAKGEAAAKIDWEIARTHIAKRDFQAAMAACRGMAGAAPGASRV